MASHTKRTFDIPPSRPRWRPQRQGPTLILKSSSTVNLDLSPIDRLFLEDHAGYVATGPAASFLGRVASRASVRLTATKIGTRVAVSQERHDRARLPDDMQMRCVSHSFRRPHMLFWDSMVYRENAGKGSTLSPIQEDDLRNITGIASKSKN
jgi:hypothetical protein